MGTEAITAALCWLTICGALAVNSLKDESASRLYRHWAGGAGVYASAAPYGAYSFQVPLIAAPKPTVSRVIPVKENHNFSFQNMNAYLKDSYGNRFVDSKQLPQSVPFKPFPQQYIQLQELPAHFAQPLPAPSFTGFKQATPQIIVGSHYRLPLQPLQTASPVKQQFGFPQSIYAGNIKSIAPQSIPHSQFHGPVIQLPVPQKQQQSYSVPEGHFHYGSKVTHNKPQPVSPSLTALPQSTSNEVIYANAQSAEQYHKDEPKFQRLQEAPREESSEEEEPSEPTRHVIHHNDKADQKVPVRETTITSFMNGIKTRVNLKTKQPLPLLDISLLEPLTFDNPLVPQVQHFLPKISEATYHKLPELTLDGVKKHQKPAHKTKSYDSESDKVKPKKYTPKKKQKYPLVEVQNSYFDEIPSASTVRPVVITIKETPNESPEFSYEINSPNYKETYKEQAINYSKETNSEPVHISYGSQKQEEPVHYSYVHSSKKPIHIKEVHYEGKGEAPKHLVHKLRSDDHKGEKQHESEGSEESSEGDRSHNLHNDNRDHHNENRNNNKHHANRNHHPEYQKQHHENRNQHRENHNQPHTNHHQHQENQNQHHENPNQYRENPNQHRDNHNQPHKNHHQHQENQNQHHENPNQYRENPNQHRENHNQPHKNHHQHQENQNQHHENPNQYHENPNQYRENPHQHRENHNQPPENHSQHHENHNKNQENENEHHESPKPTPHQKPEHREQEYNQKPSPGFHPNQHDDHDILFKPIQYYTKTSSGAFQPLSEYEEEIRIAAPIKVDPNQHVQPQPELRPLKPSPVPQSHRSHSTPSHHDSKPHQKNHVPTTRVHENTKAILIKEETPEHSDIEHLKEVFGMDEDEEKDFEKAYKNAAFGFPGYGTSNDHDKDIYNPDNYGISRDQSDSDFKNSPFQQYHDPFDKYPKSSRLSYKDAKDDNKENYFLDYSISKPESLTDHHKKKVDYYKLYKQQKPEKYVFNDNENQKKQKSGKYTAIPYNFYPTQDMKPFFAQYKAATPFEPEFDYSKGVPRDNAAHSTQPYNRYKSNTFFVEPQFQYGFEPISIPRLLDSELATMASNDSPESEKPGLRKKIYKENFYIKKTSMSGAGQNS